MAANGDGLRLNVKAQPLLFSERLKEIESVTDDLGEIDALIVSREMPPSARAMSISAVKVAMVRSVSVSACSSAACLASGGSATKPSSNR